MSFRLLGLSLTAEELAVLWGERFFRLVDRSNHDAFRTLYQCELISLQETLAELHAGDVDPVPLVAEIEAYWRDPPLHDDVVETLLVATIALKYTQSNSICLACDGQVIGMGAGQQSRVHCTRLACDKAEKWLLQQHPRTLGLTFKDGLGRIERTNVVDSFLLWDELADAEKDALLAQLDEAPEPLSARERADWVAKFDGIGLSSDAFIPFRDTIDRASRSNVRYVLQTGGSLRDDDVTAAADQYGMVMIHSGMRWFLH